MKTYTYQKQRPWLIVSSDLQQEFLDVVRQRHTPVFYDITIYDEAAQPAPEKAGVLYVPETGRLGIAWGADATWADVPSLDFGILMWLNDPESWEAAH